MVAPGPLSDQGRGVALGAVEAVPAREGEAVTASGRCSRLRLVLRMEALGRGGLGLAVGVG